jgi:putative redox protein
MVEKQKRRVDVALVEGMHFWAVAADNASVSVDGPAGDGGVRAGPSPMEMLLVALGSCAGMDVISILRKKRLDVSAYRVEVTATVAAEIPHVYTHIAIRHVIEGDAVPDHAVQRAIELSETKYCSVWAMLEQAAHLSSSYEIAPAQATG